MTEDNGFRCNLCGTQNSGRPTADDRESAGCRRCGSTVRTRGLIYALSQELFGATMPLADFPRLPGLRGLGISDSSDYAELLSTKFEYTNTWYHREPKFDVTDVPPNQRGRYDFIICSEVLEHVAPPIDGALRNLYNLLKPTGVLLVTVPYTLADSTTEHFPKLHDYGLARLKDTIVLVNRTPGGKVEIHENLVFHGGPGFALELRVLCERDLRRHLRLAGFRDVRFYAEDAPQWGIAHTGWSLPFSARKEPFALPLPSTADWVEQWESALTAIRDQRGELGALKNALGHVGQLEADLITRTEWGKKLDTELETAGARIRDLETELQRVTEWGQSMEKQFNERTEWALNLQNEVAEHVAIAERLQKELSQAHEEAARANAELEELRRSRALRVGRKLGLG